MVLASVLLQDGDETETLCQNTSLFCAVVVDEGVEVEKSIINEDVLYESGEMSTDHLEVGWQ